MPAKPANVLVITWPFALIDPVPNAGLQAPDQAARPAQNPEVTDKSWWESSNSLTARAGDGGDRKYANIPSAQSLAASSGDGIGAGGEPLPSCFRIGGGN